MSGWTTFAILAAIAATAQLFVVSGPRHYAYHTTIVFLIPAAMLLPPELVIRESTAPPHPGA